MKISFDLFDTRTLRRIYLSIGLVFALLSAFFILTSVQQHRRVRDLVIAASLNGYQAQIAHGLDNIHAGQAQALQFLASNPHLRGAIARRDSAAIAQLLDPLLHTVFSRSGAFILIGDGQGGEVFRAGVSERRSVIALERLDGREGLTLAQPFLISPEGLFLTASLTLSGEISGYTLTLGVKDSDGFSFLTPDSEGILFTAFRREFIPQFSNHNHFQWDHHLIRPYNRPEVVKAIAQRHGLGQADGQRVTALERRYKLIRVGSLRAEGGEQAGQMLFALDITPVQRVYTNFLLRIGLFTLLILALTMGLAHYLLHRLMKSWLKIESTLERRITRRTQEIIDTNAEFRQLFNSTANGIRIINQNFEVTRVNDAFCRISGRSREQIEGRYCYNVFSGVFCHTPNCPLKRLRDGEPRVEMEEVRFNREGERVICQHTAVAFRGNNGEFLGIIEDFKDITERRTAEQNLRRSQAQFSAFLDSIPVGILIKDSEGRITYQNTYLKTLYGDALLELNRQLAQENPGGLLSDPELQVLKDGRLEMEEVLTDAKGVERTYMTHKFRFIGLENSWLIGSVSIDITRRKQAEHQLYVLSKAIKNSPVGVAITTPDGVVEFVNPEYENISGRFAADLLNHPLSGIETRANNPLRTAMDSALAGDTWQGETGLVGPDGRPMWIALSVAPVYNRRGAVAHLIFLMENITGRKDYEQEIIQAKTRAEESDRLKTAFLANLSHEIRTPLNAITGFASLLNEPEVTAEERLLIPDMLFKHSNALLGLIDDIIDIAAIEANQFQVKRSECSLNTLIDEVYSEVVTVNTKTKNLRVFLKREVQEESFTILTDPHRLKQVIKHLLTNAIKFTEQGYIELGYTFWDAETLLFYVMDTGIGISAQEAGAIFRPFVMADDSNTRRYNGLGLGLAISKHIVEHLGGRIWVNTAKGEGSTFFFTTPYIPVHSKFQLQPPDSVEGDYNWDNKTILVADDIDSNFKFLQALIRPTRANLVWAKTGREAVQMARTGKVDLILMDIVMPEMNGFEAAREIKRIRRDLPIICQTAFPSPENIRASEESGMDTLLAKPIHIFRMLSTIDRFFRN